MKELIQKWEKDLAKLEKQKAKIIVMDADSCTNKSAIIGSIYRLTMCIQDLKDYAKSNQKVHNEVLQEESSKAPQELALS